LRGNAVVRDAKRRGWMRTTAANDDLRIRRLEGGSGGARCNSAPWSGFMMLFMCDSAAY